MLSDVCCGFHIQQFMKNQSKVGKSKEAFKSVSVTLKKKKKKKRLSGLQWLRLNFRQQQAAHANNSTTIRRHYFKYVSPFFWTSRDQNQFLYSDSPTVHPQLVGQGRKSFACNTAGNELCSWVIILQRNTGDTNQLKGAVQTNSQVLPPACTDIHPPLSVWSQTCLQLLITAK